MRSCPRGSSSWGSQVAARVSQSRPLLLRSSCRSTESTWSRSSPADMASPKAHSWRHADCWRIWRRRFFGSTRSRRGSRPPNPAGNRAASSRSFSDRKARRRIRGGMPIVGGYGAGGSLDRRDRDGALDHRIRRGTGPHLRVLSPIGRPEGAFVEACRLLEDMAPAVLWIDEIETGLSTTESGGEQGRIFAFFLTWMQEKTQGLFVAATANRIDLLPAEMIRKGRFDEVFFVDLPVDEERIEIFKIHLGRRGVDPAQFNLKQLTPFTIGWTGAEIEQCVVSSMTQAPPPLPTRGD